VNVYVSFGLLFGNENENAEQKKKLKRKGGERLRRCTSYGFKG